MANENNSYNQAEHNEKAANDVRNNYPDWAVTMCFYSALHWVERYAIKQGDDLEKKYPYSRTPHERRWEYVRDLARQLRDEDLRKAYNALQKASQIARYLEGIRTDAYTYFARHNTTEVSTAFANLQIIKKRLASSS